jgi:heme-degrading monooxygenase HmoA
MRYLLVRQKVAEFDRWKSAYDAHLPSRQMAGLKEQHLLRNIDEPGEVLILFEVEDLQKAREFVDSADLRTAMEKAGVVDKPDIYHLA